LIRLAREDDVPVLQDIERAAGKFFADIGMTFVAEDEPPSTETLLEYARAGRAWVWGERPVAYLIADVVDGNAHLEQVSVHPSHARQRIGAALMARMIEWAEHEKLPAVTLTTYTEVPWNGPYYERHGFRYLTEDEPTPGLKGIREAEKAHGLDRWPRACMRRDLTSESAT
jgi:GNAT superfamily N-acetyltransferase